MHRGSFHPAFSCKVCLPLRLRDPDRTTSEVNDGAARVCSAGERESEPPGVVHTASSNASESRPGKSLAVVADSDQKVFTTPQKKSHTNQSYDRKTRLQSGRPGRT